MPGESIDIQRRFLELLVERNYVQVDQVEQILAGYQASSPRRSVVLQCIDRQLIDKDALLTLLEFFHSLPEIQAAGTHITLLLSQQVETQPPGALGCANCLSAFPKNEIIEQLQGPSFCPLCSHSLQSIAVDKTLMDEGEVEQPAVGLTEGSDFRGAVTMADGGDGDGMDTREDPPGTGVDGKTIMDGDDPNATQPGSDFGSTIQGEEGHIHVEVDISGPITPEETLAEEDIIDSTGLQSKESKLIGQQLGNFKIEKVLGVGGMGAVFLAENTTMRRKVALKILTRDASPNSRVSIRFIREARTAGKLRHPNIVGTFSAGHADGHPFIELEYIKGQSLEEKLDEHPDGIPEVECLQIIKQTCAALKVAHENKVVHRDIKPANIMVTPEGVVKLTDFGLARSDDSSISITKTGTMMGTPAYMSPEQCKGLKVDGRSDFYSLGATLYHMLSGVRPFTGENMLAIAEKHINLEPVTITNIVPISSSTKSILERLMAKDINQRYVDADEVIEDIERIEQGGSVFYKIRKLRRGLNPVMVAVLILLVLGLGGSTMYFYKEYIAKSQGERLTDAMNEAEVAKTAGNYQTALDLVEEVLGIKSDHSGAIQMKAFLTSELDYRGNIVLGEEEAAQGQFEDAINAFNRAQKFRMDPKITEKIRKLRVKKWMKLGRVQREAGKFGVAYENYTEAMKYADPGEKKAIRATVISTKTEERGRLVEGHLKLAREKMAGGLFDEAEAHLADARAVDKKDIRIADVKTALRLAREFGSSKKSFIQQVEKGSEAYKKGDARQAKRRLDEASESLRIFPILLTDAADSVKILKGLRVKVNVLVADQHRGAKRFTKALDAYRAALSQVEGAEKATIQRTFVETLLTHGRNQLERQPPGYDGAFKAYSEALSYTSGKKKKDIEELVQSTETLHFNQLLASANEKLTHKNIEGARKDLEIARAYKPKAREVAVLEVGITAASASPPPGMQLLPGGAMTLGSKNSQDRNPEHETFLWPVFIDKAEVTNAEFHEFVKAGSYAKKELWDNDGWAAVSSYVDLESKPGPAGWRDGAPLSGTENHPVSGICWYEARAYARFKQKRLPTAEEWEAAAGWDFGGKKPRLYPWGNQWDPTKGSFSNRTFKAADPRRADVSPIGCLDMAGNVSEWTNSELDQGKAILKGGNAITVLGTLARNWRRHPPRKTFRGFTAGFRLAMDVKGGM